MADPGVVRHRHDDPLSRAATRSLTPLRVALAVTAVYVVVEAAAALLTHSVALLSDAVHLRMDAVAIGLSVAAITVARRGSTGGGRTYGLYRLEILASLANAALLFAGAAVVLVEAVRRLVEPHAVVHAAPML